MITSSDDLAEIQAAIYGCLDSVEKLRDAYGQARAAVEMHTEHLKAVLARITVVMDGKSATERETLARASGAWQQALADCGEKLADAHKVLSRYNVTLARLDALRGILAVQKQLMREM